jgi:porin
MQHPWVYGCVIGLWICRLACAQAPPIEDYRGDLWSRPALTGDWGGLRNTLARHGVNLAVDLVQSVQGLNSGGLSPDRVLYPYGGYAEYRLNVDTGKLGLWPGGFLEVRGESQFGTYLRGRHTGALLPPNELALLPVPFEDTSTLTNVVVTQFFAKFLGLYLGKLDTLSGDANAFAHDLKTQFMNTGLGPNPTMFAIVPYAPLGAGVLLLPTESVQVNVGALSPTGDADSWGTPYDGGVILTAETRVAITPFGLPGHQLIGGVWNSKTFTTLQQDPRVALSFLNLPGGVPERTQSGSWAAYYNFEGAALGRVAMRAKLVTSGKADVSSPIRCLADSPARWA